MRVDTENFSGGTVSGPADTLYILDQFKHYRGASFKTLIWAVLCPFHCLARSVRVVGSYVHASTVRLVNFYVFVSVLIL